MTAVLSKRTIFNSRPRELSALARKHRVPGAQLAIHHDGEIIPAEFGELEFRTGRRVTRDPAFPVGSISKCFTGTAAMILGQLGDTISHRQLLSHTGGPARRGNLSGGTSGGTAGGPSAGLSRLS